MTRVQNTAKKSSKKSTRKKNTRLKSFSFSFKDRGQLSCNKHLDVEYVMHVKKKGRGGKTIWQETCADPFFEPSQETSRPASPRKKAPQPEVIQEEFDREFDGDFVSYADNTRRKTKACLSGRM
jgi:hypothetical protein